MRWAGHTARTKDERLPKRADKETRWLQKTRKTTAKMGGLPEERSNKKAEDEEKWREMKANNRDQWK